MPNSPLVSIIIVVWNSKSHLTTCLEKLSAQSLQDFEIIIVDNGSTDGSVDNIQEKYPQLSIRIERLDSNYGFSVANNIGTRFACGEWIALLNADAFPEPNWLERLLQATEQNRQYSFFTSRQIQFNEPHLLDGAGDEYHTSGLAWRKYYNQSTSEYGLKSQEVFSACAAAALYRKEDFVKVGGFDETYFSYFEDVDLSFRLRLIGKRCLYVSQAVVYHVGSASTGKASDFAFYHGHRNLVWTFFKNMPTPLLLYYLPFHVLMNIYITLSFLIRENRNIILKSKIDAFRALPLVLANRKKIQKMRSVSTWEIYRVLTKGLLAPRSESRARTKKN